MKFQVLIVFILLTHMVSCGKKESGSNNKANENQLRVEKELTEDELALKKHLLLQGEIKQIELLKLLTNSPGLRVDTLQRLDQHLDVQCVQSRESCFIEEKKI